MNLNPVNSLHIKI